MIYYVDSEFIDDGHTIDLISIGIIREDGRELYLQSCEFDANRANDWVWHHVFPALLICPNGNKEHHAIHHGHCLSLTPCFWYKRAQIIDHIKRFCDPEKYGNPVFHGWCSGYDFVALCQLFGPMMRLPQGYPHYIKDLQQVLDEHGISDDELPPQEERLHNALADARHLKKLWEYVSSKNWGHNE